MTAQSTKAPLTKQTSPPQTTQPSGEQSATSYAWYSPTDNNGAAIDQVAIWRLIGNYNPAEFNLPSTIENNATALAATPLAKM